MTPSEVRIALLENGYVPLPCNGKEPSFKHWSKTVASPMHITNWAKNFPNAFNTGILCAGTPALDVDLMDAEAVYAIVERVCGKFEACGKIMLRYGRKPKVAILFRADTPFKKIKLELIAPDGSTDQKLEILAAGQLLVVHGMHPDTHAMYEWVDGDPGQVPRDRLPLINETEAKALIAELAAITQIFGYRIAKTQKRKAKSRTKGNGSDDTRTNWGHHLDAIRAGHALHDNLRDFAARLVASGMDAGAVVNLLRDAMEGSEAVHDERWRCRYDDIPRLVEGAQRLVGDTDHPESDTPNGGDAVVARLAKLSLLEYEKQRKLAAEDLGIRASALDDVVKARRTELGLDKDDSKQGRPIEFPEIEPWPEKIDDGAALLDELSEVVGSYVVMSDEAKTVAALWPIHTHIFGRFAITPRLCVRSAAGNCGKTTLFSVHAHWIRRPLMAASATPAVIFRVIEKHKPTMQIDEAAGMFDEAGELRRILNTGYRFDGAVLRTSGDDYEPRLFKVFAPVAFALIGKLPSDLHSRCICINLQRKLASEKAEAYRVGHTAKLDVLGRKLARWAEDNADAIANAKPELPAHIINRDYDLWAVLLSIARVAGGDWPQRVARAIVASTETGDDDSSLFEQLVADIHTVFEDKDEVSSAALVEALTNMEGRPWPEMGKNRKPLTQAKLARMLRVPGVSVSPVQIKSGTLRGYTRDMFRDMFARFLPTSPLSKCQGVENPAKQAGSDTSQSVREESGVDTLQSVETATKGSPTP
jgi:putative DNA primase/helicase